MKPAKGAKPADDVGEILGRLAVEELDRGERGRLLASLTRSLSGVMRRAGARAALSGKVLVDLVTDEIVPHLPVRDLLSLRSHHHGLSGDDLAKALIKNAARTTAGLGAAAGVLASVEFAAPPGLLAAPVQLAAETLAVVAVELKLVAELHVVYGRSPQGSAPQRTVAYLTSWAARRGLDRDGAGLSLSSVLSSAARQQLRQRIVRRLGRNLTSLAPFFAGAVAGAELNRRETVSLGDCLVSDLRMRR